MNRLHAREAALHELDFDPAGFDWIDFRDSPQSVLAFLRRASNGEAILAAFNFTPVPRHGYRLGVPLSGRWEEIANGDAAVYGGSGLSSGGSDAATFPQHGRPFSVELTLPPLAAVFLKSPPAAVPVSPREASLAAGAANAARGVRLVTATLTFDLLIFTTSSSVARSFGRSHSCALRLRHHCEEISELPCIRL